MLTVANCNPLWLNFQTATYSSDSSFIFQNVCYWFPCQDYVVNILDESIRF